MLQIKTLQDARRTRAPLTVAAPSRLHPASVAGSRVSPTSGMFVRQAGLAGSGRALGGGRGYRHGTSAQWLHKQALPASVKCRAVAVQAMASSPASSSTANAGLPHADPSGIIAPAVQLIVTGEIGAEATCVEHATGPRGPADAAAQPIRPRLESRLLSDDFELVPADGVLEAPKPSPHVLPDLEDWEVVSLEDAGLTI